MGTVTYILIDLKYNIIYRKDMQPTLIILTALIKVKQVRTCTLYQQYNEDFAFNIHGNKRTLSTEIFYSYAVYFGQTCHFEILMFS